MCYLILGDTKGILTMFVRKKNNVENCITFVGIKSYLTAKHSKTLKIARFPSRYRYFSNSSLKVYSSNGYIEPLKI